MTATATESVRWYTQLLGLALRETDDFDVAVGAADLAFSLQPEPPGGVGVDRDSYPPPKPEDVSATPTIPPADGAQFGYVTLPDGTRGWAGATPPGDKAGWSPVSVPKGKTGPGSRSGKFWKRQPGHKPVRPQKQPAAPQQAQPQGGQPAQQQQTFDKPQPEIVLKEILQLLSDHTSGKKLITEDDVQAVAKTLSGMTVKEINLLKGQGEKGLLRQAGIIARGSGNKAQLVERVARSALDQAKKTLAPKKTPAELGVGGKKPKPAVVQPVVQPPEPVKETPVVASPLTAAPVQAEKKTREETIDAHPDLSANQKGLLKAVLDGKTLAQAGELVYGKHPQGKDYREKSRQNIDSALKKMREGDPQALAGLEVSDNAIEEEKTAEGVSIPRQTEPAHFQRKTLTPGKRRGRTGAENLTEPEGGGAESREDTAKETRKKLSKNKQKHRDIDRSQDRLEELMDEMLKEMEKGDLSEERQAYYDDEIAKADIFGVTRTQEDEKRRKGGAAETQSVAGPTGKPESAPAGAKPAPGPAAPASSPTLTDRQKESLRWYSKEGYVTLNKRLRRGEGPMAHDKEMFEDLQKSFAETPTLHQPAKVFRGISFIDDKRKNAMIGPMEEAMRKGEPITLPGFTSTSAEERVAKKFAKGNGIVFNISAKHGINLGKDLSKNPKEAEFLMDQNSRFTVSGVRQQGDQTFVDLEQIVDNDVKTNPSPASSPAVKAEEKPVAKDDTGLRDADDATLLEGIGPALRGEFGAKAQKAAESVMDDPAKSSRIADRAKYFREALGVDQPDENSAAVPRKEKAKAHPANLSAESRQQADRIKGAIEKSLNPGGLSAEEADAAMNGLVGKGVPELQAIAAEIGVDKAGKTEAEILKKIRLKLEEAERARASIHV